MAQYLLIIYEIGYRAAMVKSKKSFAEFEKWVKEILEKYHDAAVEQYAKIHLFRLKTQFSF